RGAAGAESLGTNPNGPRDTRRSLEPAASHSGDSVTTPSLPPRQHAPGHYVRGPVPAHVGSRGPRARRRHGNRRRVRGLSRPREAIGAIRRGRSDEAPVDCQPPTGIELAEVRLLAPADELVAAGQPLDVALEAGQQ